MAQLLSLGARSATAAALTALHLSALWLRCPQAAQAYPGTWLHLLLYSCEEAGGGGGFQPGLQARDSRLACSLPPFGVSGHEQCLSRSHDQSRPQDAIQAGLLGAEGQRRLEELPTALTQQGYATSDLAARVAAVVAAHELGKLAGCLPGGAPAARADRAAAGLHAMAFDLPDVQLTLLAILQDDFPACRCCGSRAVGARQGSSPGGRTATLRAIPGGWQAAARANTRISGALGADLFCAGRRRRSHAGRAVEMPAGEFTCAVLPFAAAVSVQRDLSLAERV